MFATALEDGAVRSNPVLGVRIPTSAEGEPDEEKVKALTCGELAILLAALPEDWHLFFEFLTHTGLRISEAIGLRWEHLDLGDKPQVEVRDSFTREEEVPQEQGRSPRNPPLPRHGATAPSSSSRQLPRFEIFGLYFQDRQPATARKTSTGEYWLLPRLAQASTSSRAPCAGTTASSATPSCSSPTTTRRSG